MNGMSASSIASSWRRNGVQEIQTAFSTGCVRPPVTPTGAHAWGRPTHPEPRALPGYAGAPAGTGRRGGNETHAEGSHLRRQQQQCRLLRGRPACRLGAFFPFGLLCCLSAVVLFSCASSSQGSQSCLRGKIRQVITSYGLDNLGWQGLMRRHALDALDTGSNIVGLAKKDRCSERG